MEHGLRFNICDLKSSYLPNSQDTELPQRVKTSIPPHLSYSCRFWATHVLSSTFDPELANAIKSFFDDERLLFWIEVLGLLNTIRGAITVLPLIAQWLDGHSGYEDLQSTTKDVRIFIQVFAGMILHSTPHLYLSALPFSPVNSTIAKFTPKFPNNLCLKSGCHSDRTAVEIVISGHTAGVVSGVFSPDGSCIASGSWDKTAAVGCSNGTAIGQTLGRAYWSGSVGQVLTGWYSHRVWFGG
jgi:WD40 repeat protein